MMRPLGIALGPARRKATEDEAVDILLLQGWRPPDVLRRRGEVEPLARAALERFVGLGLGFERGADGRRQFDPGELANFMQWSHAALGDRFWSEQCLPLARRIFWVEHDLAPRADGRPPPPSALRPRRYRVRLRRRFDLSDRGAGARMRVRLPLPIEDAALSELTVTPEPAPDAVLTIGEARLDARVTVPPGGQVELGYEASFVARPSPAAAAPSSLGAEDFALYTRPAEGLIRVDGDARALVRELADGAPDAWALVERFWRFIMRRLCFGVINYEEFDSARPWAWLLENGWSDCQLGSAFLATLCRAAGVPARLISGYALDQESPYFHYWVEVWIDQRGWTPLDTLSWGLSRGGRDPDWADYLFGEVNYRMVTERLPRLFNGAGDVRFPIAVMRLPRLRDGGLEQAYLDADTRALVYADHVAVLGSQAL